MTLQDLTLDVEQHIEIKTTLEKAFAAVLHRFGKGNTRPDGQSLELLLEAKPGGRWYRDRGNGVGHLWGFVQVIKPPTLLRRRITWRSRSSRLPEGAEWRCGIGQSA